MCMPVVSGLRPTLPVSYATGRFLFAYLKGPPPTSVMWVTGRTCLLEVTWNCRQVQGELLSDSLTDSYTTHPTPRERALPSPPPPPSGPPQNRPANVCFSHDTAYLIGQEINWRERSLNRRVPTRRVGAAPASSAIQPLRLPTRRWRRSGGLYGNQAVNQPPHQRLRRPPPDKLH